MASYDRMDWHYGGDYPKHLPIENAGTHIGMFLAWIINNNLYSDMHRYESNDSIQKVLRKEWTGRDFLINTCDEKFWQDCMNDVGNAFTRYYYANEQEKPNSFLDDYVGVFGDSVDSLYEAENTWENYEKLRPVVDKRYEAWRTGHEEH
jgi:hypothetical protein